MITLLRVTDCISKKKERKQLGSCQHMRLKYQTCSRLQPVTSHTKKKHQKQHYLRKYHLTRYVNLFMSTGHNPRNQNDEKKKEKQ